MTGLCCIAPVRVCSGGTWECFFVARTGTQLRVGDAEWHKSHEPELSVNNSSCKVPAQWERCLQLHHLLALLLWENEKGDWRIYCKTGNRMFRFQKTLAGVWRQTSFQHMVLPAICLSSPAWTKYPQHYSVFFLFRYNAEVSTKQRHMQLAIVVITFVIHNIICSFMLLGLDYKLSLLMGDVINLKNQKLPCVG